MLIWQHIIEIKKYFSNDIRNPIAHDNWYSKGEIIYIKIDGKVEIKPVTEIITEIFNLFFFLTALRTNLNRISMYDL